MWRFMRYEKEVVGFSENSQRMVAPATCRVWLGCCWGVEWKQAPRCRRRGGTSFLEARWPFVTVRIYAIDGSVISSAGL